MCKPQTSGSLKLWQELARAAVDQHISTSAGHAPSNSSCFCLACGRRNAAVVNRSCPNAASCRRTEEAFCRDFLAGTGWAQEVPKPNLRSSRSQRTRSPFRDPRAHRRSGPIRSRALRVCAPCHASPNPRTDFHMCMVLQVSPSTTSLSEFAEASGNGCRRLKLCRKTSGK